MPSESRRGDVGMAAEELDQDFQVQVLAGYQAGEGGAEMITVSQMSWHGSLAQPDGIIIIKTD